MELREVAMSELSLPKDGGSTRSRARRKLGEMLLDNGVITQDQLDEALSRQKLDKTARVGRLLVDLGFATESQICEVVAEQLRIPAADLAAVDVPNDVLAKVSRDLAMKHVCLPWFIENRDLYLIMADPTNIAAADAVAFQSGLRVKPVVAPESEVVAAIERFYAAEESSLAQFDNLDVAEQLSVVSEQDRDASADEEAEVQAQGAPVVKLVNAVLADAIRAGASDIHVEPRQKEVELRYRVDGLLRKVMTMPKRVHNKVVSRIKIMSHMDISERRKPQDGRTFVRVGGRNFDLRVSTLPTADGEKCVLRVLVQDRAQVGLEELGFETAVLAVFREMLSRPQGMILVTGPTGSGKTSTLYAALNFLRHETTNIVTVEDPVEYRLPGVSQVAVQDKAGLTFAAGLRSILRQDPDVVMVGEIRDLETAQIALQAAQTGHLVLSTLHTNDAPSAITRLVEMGLPAYVVASSLIAVLAQRLVRRMCDCKTKNPDGTASPKGCEACRFSGFKGRMAVYELMRLTPRIRSVLLARASDDVVRRAAQATGMISMFQDGRSKVARGQTTLDEVKRVVPPDEPDDIESAPGVAEQPSSGESATDIPAPLATAVGVSRPSRILVVEDDPALAEGLKDMLSAAGYDVSTAPDGQAALAFVYRERPDLILTDVLMPGMDGLELLRRVRRDLSTCQIPVLFLTGVDGLAVEVQALDLGADDYITKPVQQGRLLSRVRRGLFRAHLLKSSQ
jgi:type IV pilus assembly protein PilB